MERRFLYTKSYISKPQKVWNDKVFAEWDQVIERGMYNMKMCGNLRFYVIKPKKIDWKVQ